MSTLPVLMLGAIALSQSLVAELLPAKLEHIQIGATRHEFNVIFPGSRVMAENKASEKVLLYVDFVDDLWDGGSFEFEHEKLTSISLLRGVTTKSIDPKGIVDRAITTYGKIYTKKIAVTAENRLNPLLVWNEPSVNLYLECPPARDPEPKERSRVRFVIASKQKPMNDLFQMPSREQLEIAVFDSLFSTLSQGGR